MTAMISEGFSEICAESAADPVVDLCASDMCLWSDLIPLIKRLLSTGRSVWIDGDSGWLMASRDPGEVSPEAESFIEGFGPASDFDFQRGRWLLGYRSDETVFHRR